MGKLEQLEEDGLISEINIIPFVDIVLVLLIIFMVTSTAMVKAALRVDLPQAASAGQSVESTLNIVFTPGDELFLDGNLVTRDQLAELVQSAVATNPSAQAVISADKENPYGDVVELIDLVKQNGIKTFALNIERTQKAKTR